MSISAATLLDGPDGHGYVGHVQDGFGYFTQFGRAAFQTTDTGATMSLKSAGMQGTPIVFAQFETVADKTITWTISGNVITFIRTDTTSAAKFGYRILFAK